MLLLFRAIMPALAVVQPSVANNEYDLFTKSKEIELVLSIRFVSSISITTVKQLTDHYEIVDGDSEKITCGNRTDATRILERIAGITSGNLTLS